MRQPIAGAIRRTIVKLELKLSSRVVDSIDMIGKLSQIDQLGQLLRHAQTRHQVISSNIANINTPNFQAKDVQFASVLKNLLPEGMSADIVPELAGLTDSQAWQASETGVPAEAAAGGQDFHVIDTPGLVARRDGNNVDIDLELAKMTENALNYQAYNQLIGSKLGMYRAAIRGS